MMKRLMPTFNRILVQKVIQPAKTESGILLPEKSSKLNSGRVVAVGPGSRDKDGKLIPVSVKEGDTVLLPEYGGTQVKLGENDCWFWQEERTQLIREVDKKELLIWGSGGLALLLRRGLDADDATGLIISTLLRMLSLYSGNNARIEMKEFYGKENTIFFVQSSPHGTPGITYG
ncbi:PREDICTED: 10 kDa chaperonin, mitochondrial-like isoform X1 [Camelina sativa]|uniref:10 kDa chaperonin, mitochondrial-like isoform X1 n=1 Tax=Camelina sativa TaxID=90675 RepID=A0ABM1RSM3_CAMSA|nr:PREDICTED: 10 kDa chaperonin, mitochondrial-like isoform X1 [Camelina sativa]